MSSAPTLDRLAQCALHSASMSGPWGSPGGLPGILIVEFASYHSFQIDPLRRFRLSAGSGMLRWLV